MTRLVKSTGSFSPFANMSWMRLWAASRPVSIFPERRRVSPGFQVATSARVSLSRSTRLDCAAGVQAIFGQSSRLGASNSAGPEPSSTKCAWRVAAQLGIIAIGLFAACVGQARIFTSSTVERPPKPCAPMPSWFTFSYSSRRSSSYLSRGPRASRSDMSIGSIRASLAITMAFSAVPPMPIPSIPGGHQPAPMVGTVFSTHSTPESEGLSMANFDFASDPPPLAATSISMVFPGTSSMLTTAGVLSFVLTRAKCGSSRMKARVHPDLEKHVDDAGVLADRAVTLGAHARVGEDLRDRVLRRGRALALVGAREVPDVVARMVVADVLERVGDALNEVFLPDRGHVGARRVPRGDENRKYTGWAAAFPLLLSVAAHRPRR